MNYQQAIREIVNRGWALQIFPSGNGTAMIVQVHNNQPVPNKYGEQRYVSLLDYREFRLDRIEMAVDECVTKLSLNPHARAALSSPAKEN